MDLSVESCCNLLARSRLLAAEEVRTLHQRWRNEAGRSADDVVAFSKWLVARQYVTQYQCDLLLRGKFEHFFLGAYKILERIGKGRMAGVYRAVHTLGQQVAIKVLPPSRARDPLLLARFQREARLALRLQHPNVVRTFQTGETDGLHYLVMEYLDGETLEDVLQRRGKLPPAEAVGLIYQALQGLQHIHEQGMVHRDLKPANLMLVPGAQAGQPDSTLRATVKIMDIGLGRAMFDEEADPVAEFNLTNEGALLGTPDYLAPEQARDARAADVRADIYSLGCVLYHALAGQPPFPDSNLLRQLMRHAQETPRPLSELNPAVPEGLAQILSWMMAKDPSQRYPTPERAAAALRVFLVAGAGPVPARSDPAAKAYLDWLNQQAPVAETVVATPVSAPPARASKPAPPPVRAVPVAAPAPRDADLPVAEEVDVELIEQPAPKKPVAAGKSKPVEAVPVEPPAGAPFGLTRREFLMLGIGAGVGVAVLVLFELVLYVLVRLLRRGDAETPPVDEGGTE
jgi:serine/threonine protein kinase